MDIQWPDGERIPLPCPVCDAPGPHEVLLRAGAPAHTLICCGACTACFFQDMNRPDYANQAESEMFQQMYLEQNASIYQMTGVLFRLDDPGIDSMLDVGCGFGYPVDLAAKVLGWRACGVDPAHYAEAGARLLQVDLRREYLTDASALGEPFGLVMGSEVIEHIGEPYPFMALLRRWMKPGGTLVLTTPNAAMLLPVQDAATLFCMLSAGSHMVLYTAQAMETMLRRAGFGHVHVERAGNTLTAFAADHPLRFHADAGARHLQGYRAYLQHLIGTAEPGSPLWNGAAGRLFAQDCHGAPLQDTLAQWDRIVLAWRARYGIDLARLRLPPAVTERQFGQQPMALLAAQAATQPFNLGGVLYGRAVLERRIPGSIPEGVLAYARPAFRVAVEARRVLEECGLIDLDLHHSAWQARLLMVDCLAELAPELEAEMLAALAVPSAAGLAHRYPAGPVAAAPGGAVHAAGGRGPVCRGGAAGAVRARPRCGLRCAVSRPAGPAADAVPGRCPAAELPARPDSRACHLPAHGGARRGLGCPAGLDRGGAPVAGACNRACPAGGAHERGGHSARRRAGHGCRWPGRAARCCTRYEAGQAEGASETPEAGRGSWMMPVLLDDCYLVQGAAAGAAAGVG